MPPISASWLKVLKDDKPAVFSAASVASQALGFQHRLQPPLGRVTSRHLLAGCGHRAVVYCLDRSNRHMLSLSMCEEAMSKILLFMGQMQSWMDSICIGLAILWMVGEEIASRVRK
jgi:hypothetical protein